MLKKITLIALIICGVAACTIKTNIRFNPDYSGNLEYVIDMSEMVVTMPDTSELTSMFNDPEMQTTLDALKATDGVSNLKTEEDLKQGIYKLSMDFANLEVLNSLLSGTDPISDMVNKSQNSNEVDQVLSFQKDKNKLLMKMPDFTVVQSEMISDANQESFTDMDALFDYQINVSFSEDIKKIKTKGAAEQSENTVKFKMSMNELRHLEEYNQDVLIVFK